jgi:hypothetical protein
MSDGLATHRLAAARGHELHRNVAIGVAKVCFHEATAEVLLGDH